MKILLISDTHFGINSFNKDRLNISVNFFKSLKKIIDNVDLIIHLGDVVDKRNIIDFFIDKKVKELFSELFEGKEVKIIVGNHDMYYKSSREINYPSLNLSKFDVIKETRIEVIGKYKCAFVPFPISEDDFNPVKSEDSIDFLFGHFGINGVIDGYSDEISAAMFPNVDKLFLGHIHMRTIFLDKFFFVGCPYQLSWSDFKNFKGVHILEDGKVKFIENKESPRYVIIEIKNDRFKILGLKSKDFETNDIEKVKEIAKNNFVKLIFEKEFDKNLFEEINSVSKYKISVISKSAVVQENEQISVESAKSIHEMMIDYLKLRNLDEKSIDFIVKKFNEFSEEFSSCVEDL